MEVILLIIGFLLLVADIFYINKAIRAHKLKQWGKLAHTWKILLVLSVVSLVGIFGILFYSEIKKPYISLPFALAKALYGTSTFVIALTALLIVLRKEIKKNYKQGDGSSVLTDSKEGDEISANDEIGK